MSSSKFIDVGSGNIVQASRVLCVAAADSAPIRRLITDARDRSVLIDCCAGKKCHSVLIMDSDHIITSALELDELKTKLED